MKPGNYSGAGSGFPMRRSFGITATAGSCRSRSRQNLTPKEYDGIKNKLPPGMIVAAGLRPDLSEWQVAGTDHRLHAERRAEIPTASSIIMKCSGRKPKDAKDSSRRLTRCSPASTANTNSRSTRTAGKTSEKIITPPVPGYKVVTTLDLHLAGTGGESAAKRKRSAARS